MTNKSYRKECKMFAAERRREKRKWQPLHEYKGYLSRKLRFLMKLKASKLIKK